MFETLKPQAPDGLLRLIELYRDDPRPGKLDLGVGMYRDEAGRTPVMRAVKSAEQHLLATQDSKSYLGPEGDDRFVQLLAPIIFGDELTGTGRLVGIQTPGGGGALRLAGELIATARPSAAVWIGTPTWPNHEPILAASGVRIRHYRYFDPATQDVLFDEMMQALSAAAAGDVVLLHGCCHNPTGADLTPEQWRALGVLLADRGLVPFIDFAYQGLRQSLEADAQGVQVVLGLVEEALIAYSCDKNFALYRDRTGALFAQVRRPENASTLRSNMSALARVNWSMPPDHGAAAVRIVLEDETLRRQWYVELEAMCSRLRAVRRALAPLHPMLQATATQNGMFALLPLSQEQVGHLRAQHGIYMADSGRINVAGLQVEEAGSFAAALSSM